MKMRPLPTKTCPMCGSVDKKVRRYMEALTPKHGVYCMHPWHFTGDGRTTQDAAPDHCTCTTSESCGADSCPHPEVHGGIHDEQVACGSSDTLEAHIEPYGIRFNWHDSVYHGTGAAHEVLSELQAAARERDRDPWATAHEAVEEALHITKHDRNDKAGDPEDNFENIAEVWTGLLHAAGVLPRESRLIGKHVAWMMAAGVKGCRDMHVSHRDNRVDGHGYLLCVERIDPTEKPAALGAYADTLLRLLAEGDLTAEGQQRLAAILNGDPLPERSPE